MLLYLAKRLSLHLNQKGLLFKYSIYQGYWLMTPRAKSASLAGIAVVRGKVITSNRVELFKKND